MTAIFSDCGRYRYRLEREGKGGGATAIIMVNPSTADALRDDHTIRKLRGFGERYEWGTLIVGNIFALRATDVTELGRVTDPVGPLNSRNIARIMSAADRVVFAWGPLAKQPRRWRYLWRDVNYAARKAGHQPLALGAPCADGQPAHPLMLSYDRAPQPWEAPL